MKVKKITSKHKIETGFFNQSHIDSARNKRKSFIKRVAKSVVKSLNVVKNKIIDISMI